jgi:hypothetical protein
MQDEALGEEERERERLKFSSSVHITFVTRVYAIIMYDVHVVLSGVRKR